MTLVRLEPFRGLRLFDRFFSGPLFSGLWEDDLPEVMAWHPAVDIHEEENGYTITADIPGVEAKDIDLSVENGVLAIKGERKSEREEKKGGREITERYYGAFHRYVRLPEDVDEKDVKANYAKGVLKISLKRGESKVKKIPVKTA